ncbi:hypothetical protein ACWCPT_29825 [Streptomyces sp. NPDC002308]
MATNLDGEHAHPTGELVAHLCPDCDTQLPADRQPADETVAHEPGARPAPLSRLLHP